MQSQNQKTSQSEALIRNYLQTITTDPDNITKSSVIEQIKHVFRVYGFRTGFGEHSLYRDDLPS